MGIQLNTFKEKIKSYSKQESMSENIFMLSTNEDMGHVLKICGYIPDMQEFPCMRKSSGKELNFNIELMRLYWRIAVQEHSWRKCFNHLEMWAYTCIFFPF